MTIRVQTLLAGELDVEEKDLFFFPRGLPGFPDFHRWVLAGEDEEVIKWLVPVDCGAVALPVAPPSLVDGGYDPVLPDAVFEELGAESMEDVVLLSILNLPGGDALKGTANLLAPLALAPKTRRGRQVVLSDDRWSVKTPLLSEQEIARIEGAKNVGGGDL
jgi:flagellar assembly factor FliW